MNISEKGYRRGYKKLQSRRGLVVAGFLVLTGIAWQLNLPPLHLSPPSSTSSNTEGKETIEYVSGIKSFCVIRGNTDFNPVHALSIDTERVEKISINTENVNYEKAGTYPVVCHVVLKNETGKKEGSKKRTMKTERTVCVVEEKEGKKMARQGRRVYVRGNEILTNSIREKGDTSKQKEDTEPDSNTPENKNSQKSENHIHRWTEQTQTVLKKEAWTETVIDKGAYDEPICRELKVCNGCGHIFNEDETDEEVKMHLKSCSSDFSIRTVQTELVHHDAVTHDVVHPAEYETVVYLTCSCGKKRLQK